MNQLGLHMLLFTSEWTEQSAHLVFDRARVHGADLVEVLMFDPATAQADMTARLAAEYGVGVVAAVCGSAEADISSPDAEVAARGEQLIKDAIHATRDMGATMLGGPTYSALQRYMAPPAAGSYERATESFHRIAEVARAAGVRVGLEAVNRYESNFVNTLDQAAQICRAAGPDVLFAHGDVFHMNIEESRISDVLRGAADVLGYLHITESNRGIIGTGNFDWTGFFDTLAEIDYTGPITYESFSPAVLNEELSALLALWRTPWSDPEAVVPDAMSFVRGHLERAQASR